MVTEVSRAKARRDYERIVPACFYKKFEIAVTNKQYLALTI